MPFIDEQKLLAAAASVPPEALTAEERARNCLGEVLIFQHAPNGGALHNTRALVHFLVSTGTPCVPGQGGAMRSGHTVSHRRLHTLYVCSTY